MSVSLLNTPAPGFHALAQVGFATVLYQASEDAELGTGASFHIAYARTVDEAQRIADELNLSSGHSLEDTLELRFCLVPALSQAISFDVGPQMENV